jgi:nucleoside-diphosphate-sugar epimerase
MSSSNKPTLLILGGAGAQNSAVAKVFSAAGTYTVHILTRSIHSPHASELSPLPNVKLIEGDCFDEATLTSAFKGVDLCFINTNGFAIGEKNEIYWGIRMYEIARWADVKHFIYSGLPYVSKNGDFDPSRRVPFVDGKGKVARKSKSHHDAKPVLISSRISCRNADNPHGLECSLYRPIR